MAEMLPFVNVVPEMSLTLDPVSGIIGAGSGSLVILNMDDINNAIDQLEADADELVESLDPYSAPLGAYPNREGNYITAGTITNVVYGFLIAVFIIIAMIPVLIKLGVL
ncbi:tetrahydromethanopterin S-methyltransferase subunit B [Methanobrevibacter sp. 87.7]|uniref:tetrahydromethanopterin S-methyltransferase subunit MtrB n=1 Tax=Methanobrevibacter sp. 87.7 TaxID=387957 RepID=UPI000B4FEE8E|nr:tetrahydromethanopterin S-methyltransferase subunit B [Methanobrevibacter sp. 87.7]OWT33394.1 tetrahydromethanopterin S-methyltransferase subunit B [Methanobrevibacter sp. 87.7]